jgi:hypothetical protein
MKTLKKIMFFLLVTLLFISSASFAGPAQSPYADTPGSKEYPNADFIVLKEKIAVTLMPDGRIEEHFFRAEKVLTYEGLDLIGDPKVAFNKDTQKLEIQKCRTYTADGRIINAKDNSYNEMTPYELEKSPDYTSIRQTVVTKVGLDINSVVELEYTIADTKPWRKFLQGGFLLQEDCPVLSKEVEIRVPDGVNLKIAVLNSELKAEMKSEAGYKVYMVNAAGLEEISYAECANHDEYLHPYLVFSNCPAWQNQCAILAGLIKKAGEKASKEAGEKVASLTDKKLSLREKVMAVQDFVATKFSTVEWPLSAFDYSPRSVARIYESSYGNQLDKAVLLGAMLESLKLKPAYYLLMARTFPEPAGQIPSLSIFSDLLVSVGVDGETLYLSPTEPAENASFKDWAGKRVLEIAEGVSGLSALPELKEKNAVRCVFSLEPKEKQVMKGTGAVTISGVYANYESAIKNGFEGVIKPYVEGTLPQAQDIRITSKGLEKEKLTAEVEFTLDLSKAAENTGFDAVLNTSLPESSIVSANSFASREKRDIAMVLKNAGSETYEITVKLPEGDKTFNTLPALKGEAGGIAVSQSFKKDGDKFFLSYSIEAKNAVIAPESYSKAREIAAGLIAPSARTLAIEEVKKDK